MVFEPIAPACDGDGLGVVQETIQDRTSRGHVTQKLAPFLQRPVAGHDGGPIFIPAHERNRPASVSVSCAKQPCRASGGKDTDASTDQWINSREAETP